MINLAYIWGAGKYGRLAFEYCKDKFDITGFIDKRADEHFNEFCGKKIISPDTLKGIHVSSIIVAVTYPSDIIDYIKNNHICVKDVYIFDGRNADSILMYKIENNEICMPEYMDKRFAECSEYEEHYSKLSPYTVRMFENALIWIKDKFRGKYDICEIACGSGQFANMLFDNGFVDYQGLDFSRIAIELARKANPDYKDKFICEDAFSYLKSYKSDKKTVFCIFEMLEHINRDKELLEVLPTGSNVIFSVPNFKSFNHLRTFNDLESIKSRYTMLDIKDYERLPEDASGKNVYHLVYAKKQ